MNVKTFLSGEGQKPKREKPFKFWARCPQCKKSFGIPPKYPVQFLQRAMKENQDELNEVLQELNENGGA